MTDSIIHPSTADGYQQRFVFRTAPRDRDATLDTIRTSQLGHMLETLTDTLILMRGLADDPHLDPAHKDIIYAPDNRCPALVNVCTSEVRTSPSYFVSHIGDDPNLAGKKGKKKNAPDLAALADITHMALRRQTLALGKLFRLPDELQHEGAEYQAAIDRYLGLLEKTKPTGGDHHPDHNRIPAGELQAFETAYRAPAAALFQGLRRLPHVTIHVGDNGQETAYPLPNNVTLSSNPLSHPASILYIFHMLGKGAADKNKRPAIEFATLRDMSGSESLISDAAQGVLDLASAHGVPLPETLDRATLKQDYPPYVRNLQLALSFCRVADCGYPVLYDDLEQMIRLCGGTPAPIKIQNPQEAALMIYAADRGFARADIPFPLRALAERVSTYTSMDQITAEDHALLAQARAHAQTHRKHVIASSLGETIQAFPARQPASAMTAP